MQPNIIYREQDIWVVDKPAGWAVHPTGDGHPELLSWLIENGAPRSIAPAHRLDLDTSGVALFGLTPDVLSALGAQFESHAITKSYRALVYGRPHNKGTIRRPLQDGRRKQRLDAVTRYRLVDSLGRYSLIQIRPETGRKHQIRRHFQGIGHGIVGDRRYRCKGKPPAHVTRLCLHAERLELPDGRVFTADWPEDLAQLVKTIRPTLVAPPPTQE
jgi:RluA family pseudouridine synthase